MKRIFLMVVFVLLVLKPSFAGPGPGPVSLQNCQAVYDRLNTMLECPDGVDLEQCVDAEAKLTWAIPNNSAPFCTIEVYVPNIPEGIKNGSQFLAVKENNTKTTLGEVEQVEPANSSPYILFQTSIYDMSEFNEYSHFFLYQEGAWVLDYDYALFFTNIDCDGQSCGTTTASQSPSVGSGITDLGSGIGSGIGGKVPVDIAGDDKNNGPTGGPWSSNQNSKSTAGGTSQTEGGTLTGCYQISPTVPYHFSVEWFGLLALLLVGLRRLLIAR